VSLIDLTGREPTWSAASRRTWTQALRDTAEEFDVSTRNHPLGEALRGLLGLAETPFVTAGVRAVIPVLASLGRRVVVESPTFADVPRLFRRHGCAVTVGPLARAVDIAVPAERHLIWVTSPGRNPDGGGPCARTIEALARFQRAGGMVVQNESYRWYVREPDRIAAAVVVGSLHKLAGGWSRLGWMSGPLPEPLRADLPYQGPPAHWQSAWARFIATDGLRPLVATAWGVNELTARVAGAVRGDPGPAWSGSGPSLLLRLPGDDPAGALCSRLGIAANPGSSFHAGPDTARLCLTGWSAGELDWERIRDIRRLLGGKVIEPGDNDRAPAA
jgi:DNA-binding transcriptional MocR family regulator